jgi:iron only hydrogenase large subunit-like protein
MHFHLHSIEDSGNNIIHLITILNMDLAQVNVIRAVLDGQRISKEDENVLRDVQNRLDELVSTANKNAEDQKMKRQVMNTRVRPRIAHDNVEVAVKEKEVAVAVKETEVEVKGTEIVKNEVNGDRDIKQI